MMQPSNSMSSMSHNTNSNQQMSIADQRFIKALPGNDACADCPTKNPQWASVSFGNLFCLECSGIHRSLGVHISFVRSVAMDNWTDAQLNIMRNGGNNALNDALAKHLGGGQQDPKTIPIPQKYTSPAALLYKAQLKARAEGRPEPKELPLSSPTTAHSAPAHRTTNTTSISSFSTTTTAGLPAEDPNGMQRLMGESDEQYIARQSRLRSEAQARLKAKTNAKMVGIGSDPSYNPQTGYNNNSSRSHQNSSSSSSFLNSFSAMSSSVGGGIGEGVSDLAGSLVGGLGSALEAVSTSVNQVVQEKDLTTSLKAVGGSFWGSLSSSVSHVTSSVSHVAATWTQPDDEDQEDTTNNNNYSGGNGGSSMMMMMNGFGGGGGMDGLADLQREISLQKPSHSVYSGFGSDSFRAQQQSQSSSSEPSDTANPNNNHNHCAIRLEEAPGLPGEDRNGVERLTGERDDQYVMRQTRLRDEARARMAAKFGTGNTSMMNGMGGVGSASYSSSNGNSNSNHNRVGMPNHTSSYSKASPSPQHASYSSSFHSSGIRSAPASGNAGPIMPPAWATSTPPTTTNTSSSSSFSSSSRTPPPKKAMNADDFFSSFGT